MFKYVFLLFLIPSVSTANICINIFKVDSSPSKYQNSIINELIKVIESKSFTSLEPLYHLMDITTSNTSRLGVDARVERALNSLSQHEQFNVRVKAYELLTGENGLMLETNFFKFFQTKAEVNKFLNYRLKTFNEQAVLPTAAEIISFFKYYKADVSISYGEYLRTFDENGYFLISKEEIKKLLNQSPHMYDKVLNVLTQLDSRVHPDQLYQSFKNVNLIESSTSAFKSTLQAIEQQGIKLKRSDFNFLIANTKLASDHTRVWQEILSYILRHPEAYMTDFIGENGFLTPLLIKTHLDTVYGKVLYQKIFEALEVFEYEMTPAELQLSFSILTSYKPSSYRASERQTFGLKSKSPVETFYNYLSVNGFKIQLSARKHVLHVLNQNLFFFPSERLELKKLQALIDL